MRSPAFAFGENWLAFIDSVDERAIQSAEKSLTDMLGDIRGRSFLDIGCGSGLSSLAAARLGAKVTSIDYDQKCVECTQALQQRFGLSWPVSVCSVLDHERLYNLGRFDIVYSWGVLHHTSNLWRAVDNAANVVAPRGRLWIALYNDQGLLSKYWSAVKKEYNSSEAGRLSMTVLHLPYLAVRLVVRAMKGSLRLERGMSLWTDYLDWLGGYPFEVAKPARVRAYLGQVGFNQETFVGVGRRHGCNEFVFRAPDFLSP